MDTTVRVDAAHTAELTEATRALIVEVCLAAHEDPEFKRLFEYFPGGGQHVLGYAGGRLVSHAIVTTRWLQPEGQPILRTAYVDAVSTLPAVQGQGYGSAVMRRLAGLVAGEYDIACLETDRQGFYARLGWEEWRGPLAGRSEQGLVPTPNQTGVMILRLPRTPALDLDGRLTIECQRSRIW
jgi:aminoglycoside 2'-N-acetyltransferase I